MAALGVSTETTVALTRAGLKTLGDLGIVAETTGQKKNRSFSYQTYIQLLTK